MAMIRDDEALTFDDVSLVPNYSTIKSRREPSTKVEGRNCHYTESMNLEIPIISAPMNSIFSSEMAWALYDLGGTTVTHRYVKLDELLGSLWDIWDAQQSPEELPFFAVGATGDYMQRVDLLFNEGVRKFCIDVANGFTEVSLVACAELKSKHPDILLMAGNVCTGEGYKALVEAGADLIRVGIGSGGVCKTRIVTGFGVPQITALQEVRHMKEELSLSDDQGLIIADGGLRNSGDIVKALCFADAVMLGSLLAGTDQTPGEVFVDRNGKKYKTYMGMASEAGRSLFFDEEKSNFTPEGVSVQVPCKGSVENVVNTLIGGLKSGMSYCDAHNLKELREKARFIRVTNNGVIEGHPHLRVK